MDPQTLIANAYLGTLAVLALYGLHRLSMILRFRWEPSREADPVAPDHELPLVTLQLPLYNERTVAARVIRAAGALDYPPERLEIQVLDDSTDETRGIVDREVAALRERGLDAKVVRRPDRHGYKAGALDFGQRTARGELIAIFDADFTPRPDFLRSMVGRFADPCVGMVQARWEHENRDESVLTRAQSILLDGHFVIEHKVRHDHGLYFNFNGTAGVWRRAAITDAGGWQHDTLTEDLDLSYRAQLAGWRFVYEPLVLAPAEVPPDIAAFKSQQHRWAKGSVQVGRKLLGRILRAKVPLRVKFEALAHLTGNAGYPLVLALAILLPLSISEHARFGGWGHILFFLFCTFSVVLFYETSQRAIGRTGWQRLRDVPAGISLGIGMCVSQTRAVLEGFFRETGAFVRTPKRGDAPAARRYTARLKGLPGIEILLALWFAWACWSAVEQGLWGTLPFLLLFFSSFAWVGGLSLSAWARAR
ncbi:MAG: glycosyltransferase [Planctomycetota bacterium]|nr:glycosyltransferase [Planctomycetota bacterium]